MPEIYDVTSESSSRLLLNLTQPTSFSQVLRLNEHVSQTIVNKLSSDRVKSALWVDLRSVRLEGELVRKVINHTISAHTVLTDWSIFDDSIQNTVEFIKWLLEKDNIQIVTHFADTQEVGNLLRKLYPTIPLYKFVDDAKDPLFAIHVNQTNILMKLECENSSILFESPDCDHSDD